MKTNGESFFWGGGGVGWGGGVGLSGGGRR